MATTAQTLPLSEWASIPDAVFHYAEKSPERTAIVQGDETLTYKEFASLIGKTAVYLRRLGIKPGDSAAVVMSTSIDHIILSFALMRIGAAPFDMPPTRPKMSPIDPIKRFKIKYVFSEAGGTRTRSGTIHEIDAGWRDSIRELKGDHRHAGNPDEVLYMSVTSGSTGLPKGVITTHRQWMARFDSAAKLLPRIVDAQTPPRLLLLGGMGFSAFFFFLANQFFIGGPVVLMAENHNADHIIRSINEWDDGVTLITPPLSRQMIAKAPSQGVLFPKLRALCIGAAPLYPEEKIAIREKLSPNFYEVYGSAACGFLSALPPEDIATKAESVGSIAPGVVMEIVDAAGKPVPAGKVGHMRCQGPGISKAFIDTGDPETASPEGFRDGWYYPGDLAVLPGDGQIYLRGRITDVIHRNGVEIYPTELEEILLAHPSVTDAAVVTGPKNDKGDQVIAFVVPRGEPRRDELAAHCRARIAPEKFFDRVFFAKELPKNSNGKVDKPKLKTAAARGPERPKVAEKAG